MSDKTKSSKNSFLKKFNELEEIVDWFSSNEIQDIDESLKKYEQGAKLANELKKYLHDAENKVNKIRDEYNLE